MATEHNFTKRWIESLPAPTDVKRAEYKDSKTRGLRLFITQSGHKSFYLYRKIKGRPERIKLGVFPDTTVERTRKLAGRLNAEIDEGANPAQTKV